MNTSKNGVQNRKQTDRRIQTANNLVDQFYMPVGTEYQMNSCNGRLKTRTADVFLIGVKEETITSEMPRNAEMSS